MAEVDHETPERHASWTELFFDLVVVAGVGQLAHLLAHGDSLSNVGLYVLLYLAFWISWATYTVTAMSRATKLGSGRCCSRCSA
jgi:low temperature requirement protein LtrA